MVRPKKGQTKKVSPEGGRVRQKELEQERVTRGREAVVAGEAINVSAVAGIGTGWCRMEACAGEPVSEPV